VSLQSRYTRRKHLAPEEHALLDRLFAVSPLLRKAYNLREKLTRLFEGLVKNALFIFTPRNASYGSGSPIHLASGQFRNHKSVKQL
jgi:hypothetical protein